ncbi:hypothetical protein N7492_006651 [Penicillium capsulatum]|uniref:Uncharacterized protein n=1 Tax=Penicillium capsulatum TaxID=69766 RepID=A0A9W9HZQ8_9EURO|nr:hypothetical protein N7492_006651 [Penicillium capsulatum]
MDSQGPPDWFMPVEDPTNNANNPTLSSSLGAGTKLAQAVRDLEGQGDQLALPGTGDEPFDIERFLNDRRAKQLPTKMEGIDEDRENQDAKTEQGNDGMNYEDDDTLSESERID